MPDQPRASAWSTLAQRGEGTEFIAVLAALALLLGASYLDFYRLVWRSDDQGHGPIIVAVSVWLIWRQRVTWLALPSQAAWGLGFPLLVLGWGLFVLGRSQGVLQAEALSHIALLSAVILLWRGFPGLRLLAFPLFFLVFMIPLPGTLVQAVTLPLKSGVSYAAEHLLYQLGYPIARSGVTLQIAQYQLLVADACAGLNSMFTLESLGLLYMNIMGHTNRLRNVLLALLIVPISFVANVVRVVILILVTYYFGDAVGQGFVHGFAGMVLFGVAFILMLVADSMVGRLIAERAA